MPDVYNVLFLCTGNSARLIIAEAQRIGIFAALPLRALDALTLHGKLREIGLMEGATRVPERH